MSRTVVAARSAVVLSPQEAADLVRNLFEANTLLGEVAKIVPPGAAQICRRVIETNARHIRRLGGRPPKV